MPARGSGAAGPASGVPEALHARALLASQRNKTDQADALELAQFLRGDRFKTVHVKRDQAHRMHILLTHRRNLKRKGIALEIALRHTPKAFGAKLHATGGPQPCARRRPAPLLATAGRRQAAARDVLFAEFGQLSRIASDLPAGDEVCRRFMSVPGVG